jgi:hypothetical protein
MGLCALADHFSLCVSTLEFTFTSNLPLNTRFSSQHKNKDSSGVAAPVGWAALAPVSQTRHVYGLPPRLPPTQPGSKKQQSEGGARWPTIIQHGNLSPPLVVLRRRHDDHIENKFKKQPVLLTTVVAVSYLATAAPLLLGRLRTLTIPVRVKSQAITKTPRFSSLPLRFKSFSL